MRLLAVAAFLVCMLSAPVMAADVNVNDQTGFDANAQNGNTLVIGDDIDFDTTRGGVILEGETVLGLKGADGIALTGTAQADGAQLNWGEKGRLLGLKSNDALTLTISGALDFTEFGVKNGGISDAGLPAAFGGVFASMGSLEIKSADGLVFAGNKVDVAKVELEDGDDIIGNGIGGALAAVNDITVTNAQGVKFIGNSAVSNGYVTPVTGSGAPAFDPDNFWAADNEAAGKDILPGYEHTQPGYWYDEAEDNDSYKGYALGGAVASINGTVNFSDSTGLQFIGNTVTDKGPQAEGVYVISNAQGGAIYGKDVNLSKNENLYFKDNKAVGANAASDNSIAIGSGTGGAVMAIDSINLSGSSLHFEGNVAQGGNASAKPQTTDDAGSYTGMSGVGGALAALDAPIGVIMPAGQSYINLSGATGHFINNVAIGGKTEAGFRCDDTGEITVRSSSNANVSGLGGAIASRGSINLSDAELTFTGNRAIAGGYSDLEDYDSYVNLGEKSLSGLGGALFLQEGLNVSGATLVFEDNRAYGAHVTGTTGNGTGSGQGGAIYFQVLDQSTELEDIFTGGNLTFVNNRAIGGDAKAGEDLFDEDYTPSLSYGAGFSGNGGAVGIGGGSVATKAENLLFEGNIAQGGDAYASRYVGNMASVASGRGGAIHTGSGEFKFTTAVNVTFIGNQALGGDAYNNDDWREEGKGYNASTQASGLGGAIFSTSKLVFENAEDLIFADNLAQSGVVHGAHDRVEDHLDSGQGGAIFANSSLTIEGTDIAFVNNTADGNQQEIKREYTVGLGGAIYVMDNLAITNTGDGDIIFMGNVAKGGHVEDASSARGGAVYFHAMRSEDGHDKLVFDLETQGAGNILFANNKDGYNGDHANAFYFANMNERQGEELYDNYYDVNVNAAKGSYILVADGMDSQGDDAFEDKNKVVVEFTKEGLGDFVLGAVSQMDSAAAFNIEEGRFIMLDGTELNLNHEETSSFSLKEGAGLHLAVMRDSAYDETFDSRQAAFTDTAVIKAKDIDLSAGLVTVDKQGLMYDLPAVGRDLLVLQSNNAETGEIGTEITKIGAFDYDENLLAWTINKDGNTALSLRGDVAGRLNFTRSGGSAMTAPLAILANNPMAQGVFSRMENAFKASAHYAAEDAAWYGKNVNVWADATYRHTKQTENAKYKINTPGWIAGIDFMITDRLFVGGAVAVSLPEYRSNDANVDATSAGFAIYAGLVLPWQLELGAFGGYSNTDYDQKRRTVWEGEWSKIKNDYDSDTLHMGLSLARAFSVSANFDLKPFVTYEFMRIDVKGNNEDSADPMALHFHGYKNNLHRLSAGLDAAYKWENGAYIAGRAYYMGTFGDRKGETTAYFVNDPMANPFKVAGDVLDNNSLGLGASFGIPVGGAVEFTGGYNFLLGSESKSHQGYLGLSIKF